MFRTAQWLVKRLRAMSVAEVLYRLRQQARSLLERTGVNISLHPEEPNALDGPHWIANPKEQIESLKYIEEAESILLGFYDVFELRKVQIGFPPEWNCNPKSHHRSPLSFGKFLDYRNEDLVGDIKYLWEPNRHLELVRIAQAYSLTQEDKYLSGCQELLSSWFDSCQYPLGANWSSSLELAIRLVNWSVAWNLLGGEDSELFQLDQGQALKRSWLDSVYQHQEFISSHLSRYSSANNHLLGEYMGLYIASCTWPRWKRSDRIRLKAKAGFEFEALKQTSTDGVNREHGIWYHHEVAEMMLLCGLVARSQADDFAPAFWNRLEHMLEFLVALRDIGGHIPAIGDSDDAVMTGLNLNRDGVYDSLLAMGAIVFGRADFAFSSNDIDDKALWLLGPSARSVYASLKSQIGNVEPVREFPEGGYYLLGDKFGTPDEVRIVVDSGPLGYLSIAAHGHADALSMNLSVCGAQILIDPGTFSYHSEPKWRNYFRGTSAHNTIRVDALDQSESGGNFLWTRHAQSWCEVYESTDQRDLWVGAHDGYSVLDDPVHHKRKILFTKSPPSIQVEDSIECEDEHSIEVFWHLSPLVSVRCDDRVVTIQYEQFRLDMHMPDCSWLPELVVGRETPPLGWVSPKFGYKEPTTTIVWSGNVHGRTILKTSIDIQLSRETF